MPDERGVPYLPQLDALRFVAFLMVYSVHAIPAEPGAYPIFGNLIATAVGSGRFGVDLFFVLSAYLITSLLVRERENAGRLDIRAFYSRRALRILPLFFSFLAVVAVVRGIEWPHLVGFATFTGNFVMAATGLPDFAIAPAWSLCVEWQFYLIWPLVVGRARCLRTIAVAMLAFSLGARSLWAVLGISPEMVWLLTFTRLDPFAFGVLLAVCPLPRLPAFPAIVLGLAGVVAAEATLRSPTLWVISYTIAAISCALVVAGTLRLPILPRLPIRLGQISYGLYLFHAAIIAVAANALDGSSPAKKVGGIAAALLITIAIAALSHRYLESPFLRLKPYCSRPYAWRSSTTALRS